MQSLREFLIEKARDKDQEERRKRREEWINFVMNLIAQLGAWLKEADSVGVLEIYAGDIEKQEQGLSTYRAPSLTVRLRETVVQIVPMGRNVIAFVGPPDDGGVRAEGRVDVTNGTEKYILYRTLKDGERWYVLDERYEVSPLTQNRFETLMKDLLS